MLVLLTKRNLEISLKESILLLCLFIIIFIFNLIFQKKREIIEEEVISAAVN